MTTDLPWVGWYRRDRRSDWLPLVAGESEAKVLDLLLARVAGGDKTVLPNGRDPNRKSAVKKGLQ